MSLFRYGGFYDFYVHLFQMFDLSVGYIIRVPSIPLLLSFVVKFLLKYSNSLHPDTSLLPHSSSNLLCSNLSISRLRYQQDVFLCSTALHRWNHFGVLCSVSVQVIY